jgi:ataxia telangiectasia mutated family protein
LEGVAPLKTGEEEEVLDGDDEPLATAGASLRTASMSLTRRSRNATPQTRRTKSSPAFRKEVDDLVACLHQLVRATNAPLATNELNVVEAMHTFLVLADSYRLSYNEAFATINAVLARTATSSLELTQKMVMSLVPLVKDLWWAKSTSLRNEMLVTLVLTKDHVSALVGDTAQATFRIDLENLLEALQADYSKRLERDQMHMSDLVLDCTDSAYGK